MATFVSCPAESRMVGKRPVAARLPVCLLNIGRIAEIGRFGF
jgi:hypothetical protein